MQEVAEAVKRKIIFWWLTHCYLRMIGKRYPEHFEKQINDLTDNRICRKIMLMRYTGDTQKKFEVIAIDMGMDVRNVFSYHKSVVDKIISST